MQGLHYNYSRPNKVNNSFNPKKAAGSAFDLLSQSERIVKSIHNSDVTGEEGNNDLRIRN
jgi:hypothetical protein